MYFMDSPVSTADFSTYNPSFLQRTWQGVQELPGKTYEAVVNLPENAVNAVDTLGYNMGTGLKGLSRDAIISGRDSNEMLQNVGRTGMKAADWIRANRRLVGGATVGLGALGLAGAGYGAYRGYRALNTSKEKK